MPYSEDLLNLGCIHAYLLVASDLMEERRSPPHPPGKFYTPTRTAFGHDVENDEINWWVFKRETDLVSLRKRTEGAQTAANALKHASDKLLRKTFHSMAELLQAYNHFAQEHSAQIEIILEYVKWLYSKDELAPTMLFNYRTWGSTRMTDRYVDRITPQEINDPIKIEQLTAIVLGLTTREVSVIDKNRRELEYEAYEALLDADAENQANAHTIHVSQQQVEISAARDAANEFAVYFERLRNSLNNIVLDIDRKEDLDLLFSSDTFWQAFIPKAAQSPKTEQKYWDFKETLDMWRILNGQEKKKAAHKFAELVAGFANNQGGAIIVGVTDAPPRQIVGIGTDARAIENFMKYTCKVIGEYIETQMDFVHLQQVYCPDVPGDLLCLVIVIQQTKPVLEVKSVDGQTYSFPFREETGLVRKSRGDIHNHKMGVKSNNYHFVEKLKQFVYEES